MTCTQIFVAILSVVAEKWKQSESLSTSEWEDKCDIAIQENTTDGLRLLII